MTSTQPNILIILTDEERYAPTYETPEITEWRKTHLRGREKIRKNGLEFHRHYTAATACVPSRASLFTGQYPPAHGGTRTTPFSSAFSTWVDPKTLPTMGHYFSEGGYETYYVGKWHLSDEDLTDDDGNLIFASKYLKTQEKGREKYTQHHALEKFGWKNNPWMGPEPHGAHGANFGLYRDPEYAQEVIKLLERKQAEIDEKGNQSDPFLMVCSFVNPHDIVLRAAVYKFWLRGNIDSDSLPEIPEPANAHDDLSTKPSAFKIANEAFKKLTFSPKDWNRYRRFYYYLHEQVDREIERIYDALAKTSFFENTIVVLTSDHGDLVSSHGFGVQKFYNAYEESIHIPMVISNPVMFPSGDTQRFRNIPTSHVDVLPTLLSLAGINQLEVAQKLTQLRDEVRPDGFKFVPKLVGNDLSPFLRGNPSPNSAFWKNLQLPPQSGVDQAFAVYFMTEDEVTKNPNSETVLRSSFPLLFRLLGNSQVDSVRGACHIESVICYFAKTNQLFKLTRFWENPKHWTHPYEKDVIVYYEKEKRGQKHEVTKPAPSEYEMYDLIKDPAEMCNLYNSECNLGIQKELFKCLNYMRNKSLVEPPSHCPHPQIPYFEEGLCNAPEMGVSEFIFGWKPLMFVSSMLTGSKKNLPTIA